MMAEAVVNRFIGCKMKRRVLVEFADDADARSDHTGEMTIGSE